MSWFGGLISISDDLVDILADFFESFYRAFERLTIDVEGFMIPLEEDFLGRHQRNVSEFTKKIFFVHIEWGAIIHSQNLHDDKGIVSIASARNGVICEPKFSRV